MNRDVLAICTAYEQGYGHGLEMRNLGNPYASDTDEAEAWDYGYEIAYAKAEKHNDP